MENENIFGTDTNATTRISCKDRKTIVITHKRMVVMQMNILIMLVIDITKCP